MEPLTTNVVSFAAFKAARPARAEPSVVDRWSSPRPRASARLVEHQQLMLAFLEATHQSAITASSPATTEGRRTGNASL